MDEGARVRRKDTTKGPPLRILSLDGGGVRGYSMLIILQELMHRTFVEIEGRAPKRHEIPKPCDHFDLIAGTGTGGLIAIMLGRLRLDLDTCKEVYVRMTRRVFETDKRLMGIPISGTMFKASKLEEAIRECVREHSIFDDEGNDALANAIPMTPDSPRPGSRPNSSVMQRSMSQSSKYSQIGMSPMSNRMSVSTLRFGNPNTLLYDTRENRTKTAVTAVLKGTTQTTLLRSYDSRKETAPDVNCTIWQAGRATSATAMAFKPIQVGQSVYLDEGAGKYNPSPRILDEAVQNEWPGREVGVFVSIGTGKRPSNTSRPSQEWWEGFLGGSMGDFAEARRRLVAKLEACETTHQTMLREHLSARGVNVDNYYRLNVEVGVGEFGMNEWSRLADISTSTRLYLAKDDIQVINCGAAAKMAKIHLAKIRLERAEARRQAGTDGPQFNRSEGEQNPWERPLRTVPPVSNPTAVELPGDDGYNPHFQYDMHRPSIADQKYTVVPDTPYAHHPSIADMKYTVVSSEFDDRQHSSPPQSQHQHNHSLSGYSSPYQSPQLQPAQVNYERKPSPRVSADFAPPIPPKTPVPGGLPYPSDQPTTSPTAQQSPDSGPRTFMNMGDLGRRLPYPDVEGPPPPVNNANKPQISR